MKSYISAAAIFAALLLLLPAAPLLVNRLTPAQAKSLTAPQSELSQDTDKKSTEENDFEEEKLKVLDITTGKVEEISSFEYVVGAVAAQMPAAFEPEALKAQAVAAYTYAVRQREKAKTAPDKELCGAYFSNDTKKYQAYFTVSQQKHFYGDNYEDYREKLEKAVSEVKGQYMTYDGEPIIAAFHSLSTGMTESAANVWGSDIPYLVPVESKYDNTAPKYTMEFEFTTAEMKKAISSLDDITPSDKPEEWFGEPRKSDSGTVLSIDVCGKCYTGQQIRAALELCSAAFDIEFNDGFVVTARGSGHGVGMSQFGANELAKTGKTYEEILKHYYKGVEIEK